MTQGSGELEFPEFVQLAAQFLIEEDAEEMQNELKEAFRLYDKEGNTPTPSIITEGIFQYSTKWYVIVGNGYITTATLREILHELDDKLSPDDLDGIIAEIDEDGSGTIDFDGTWTPPLFHTLLIRWINQLCFIFRIHGNDDWRIGEPTRMLFLGLLLLFYLDFFFSFSFIRRFSFLSFRL